MFFPAKNQMKLGNEAIIVCFSCPVRQQCEEYREATNSNFGIWAGRLYGRNST